MIGQKLKGAAQEVFFCTPNVAGTGQLEHFAKEKSHQKRVKRQEKWLRRKTKERNIDFQRR